MQHDPMTIRAAVILMSVPIAALFWNLGSNVNLVLIHIAFPIFWGVAIGLWWLEFSWWLRTSGLVAVVMVSEALRVVVYGLEARWEYVTSDIVAQYLMVYSLAAQLVVAFVTLVAAGAVAARRRQHHAA